MSQLIAPAPPRGYAAEIVSTVTRPARVALSVVIPTLNEARRIRDAVAHACGWADEVLVIDGGSTDDTVAIARAAGATVLECPGATIGQQRNAGIARARHEWVLALDTDERAAPELIADCARLTERERAGGAPHDAYEIRVREHLMGREITHGSFSWHYKARLFRRRFRFTEIRAHERLEHVADTGRLQGTILHHGCRDMHDQLRKMVLYATWQSDEMYAAGRRASLSDLFLRPLWRAFRELFLFRGWRGGTFTWIQIGIAVMSTFVKYALLWVREDADRRATAAASAASVAATGAKHAPKSHAPRSLAPAVPAAATPVVACPCGAPHSASVACVSPS